MEMAAPLEEQSWYAVLTRSRQEKISAAMLDYLSVANFLPLVKEERKWSDRKQIVSVPLFPSYLFVRMAIHAEIVLRVLKVPGVVDFVRGRTGPLAVPDAEIADVRAMLSHGVGCSPYPFPRVGDRVRVVRGALAGIEGTLIRSGSQSKLVISIEMIQRSVAASVAESDVEAIYNVSTREMQSIPA